MPLFRIQTPTRGIISRDLEKILENPAALERLNHILDSTSPDVRIHPSRTPQTDTETAVVQQ